MCHIMSCVRLVIIVFMRARLRPKLTAIWYVCVCVQQRRTEIAELDNCQFEMSFSDLMRNVCRHMISSKARFTLLRKTVFISKNALRAR